MVADRNLLLSAGTVIPCTLQTAINSTQAGFVSCVINHDVYSENGRIVLLDKGTKVLGQYSGGITQGQARLFVVWTRALTPRGVAIDLGSPAAGSLGRAGLPGWRRYAVLGAVRRWAGHLGAGGTPRRSRAVHWLAKGATRRRFRAPRDRRSFRAPCRSSRS